MCLNLKFSEAFFLVKDANILHVHAALSHEVEGLLPSVCEFGWASVLVWMFWRRKNFLDLSGIRLLCFGHPVHDGVTMLSKLSQLLYHN